MISVIICSKNSERYISECIDSVLGQTYQDIEVLVVVNDSSDRTLDILKTYDDERLIVFETKIGQLNYNLNFALDRCRGDIIARMDADDICSPFRLERQLFYMNDYDVVGSNLELIDEYGEVYGGNLVFPEHDAAIRRQIYYRSVLAHPSIMIRKEVLMSVSGYMGGRYAQDYDLWLRLMRNSQLKFYNIQENLVFYRVHHEQSKGSSSSYADVSGYLLRESLLSKRADYFIGALIYYIKGLFK